MKQKITSTNADDRTTTQKLLDQFAANPNNTVDVLHNANNVEAICIQSTAQKKLFAKYGDVFQMDGTYKTNKLGWALYSILVSDGNCVGQPVYHFLLKEENKDMIRQCLTAFSKVISFYFPNTNIQLTSIHQLSFEFHLPTAQQHSSSSNCHRRQRL
jgi:MULE transposase domain